MGPSASVSIPNPVYMMWYTVNNPAAAVNASRFSDQENQTRFDNMVKALQDCGGANLLACKSYWNNEAYPYFGVHAFPDIETLQGYYTELEKLQWMDFNAAHTLLGIAAQ